MGTLAGADGWGITNVAAFCIFPACLVTVRLTFGRPGYNLPSHSTFAVFTLPSFQTRIVNKVVVVRFLEPSGLALTALHPEVGSFSPIELYCNGSNNRAAESRGCQALPGGHRAYRARLE
jgi:hypothetical protein